MGENLQNSTKLDPPPKPPDCSTLSGGKSSPTTTQRSPITPISDSSPNSIDLSLKNHGTNPKVIETPNSDQNLDMGPSPMIPEGPKTLGVGIDDSSTAGFAAKEPFIHMGEPAIVLTESEEATLADPYKYTLVGKFPHRKPTMRKVGLIDTTHILIHLTHEEDYSRFFLKPSWYIDGCPMRVLKWTCDFTPEQETPIVPVWRIDEATTDLRRPSEARVCIEVNLEHKLPDRVWIERAGNRGFWQTVIYEKRPIFCFSCKHLGHSYDQCTTVPPPPPAVVAHPPVRPPITRTDKDKGKVTFVEPKKQWVPVSAVPSVLPTTITAVVTESESASTVPTSTRITVDPEVPPYIHSVAEPTPNAPIEVPTSPIITSIAPIPTATTDVPPESTHMSSPPLKTHTDGTQSAQGSGTGTVPQTTLAQGLLAEISSERHGVKHMLIDHFKKDHGMKVGSTMRFAIEDLVFKLFGEGPSVSKTPTHTPSPGPSITAPTHNKVKEHIQRDMDGMGLGNCMQNAEDDVPTASKSISHDLDFVAQNTMRLDTPTTSTMRSDAPAFRPTFSAPPSEQFLSPKQAPTRRRDPSPTSEPDIADYYDPEMFQSRRMTRSMSMYYHPKIYPREYP
ncbi:uncharacterized protein LOC111392796 [Olea europaea var. sylvestris]|uniref:uncharacterized protein LOC111392796 n=1 Tax=Olea europaea var. sylvestris TaxID=158386 RepID=UPI000C1D36E5|nr:uncharacterized protein LOC111392796 [Olea europaea var. sylvestris]